MTIKSICIRLIFVIVPFSVLGNHSFEDRIKLLKNSSGKSTKDTLATILDDLSLQNLETELKFTSKMLDLKNELNKENYFLVLRHYAKIVPSNNQALFDSCLEFARNNDLGSYISSLYVLKSTFYRKDARYDSAMVCTLHARDEAIKYGNIEQKANVLHLLGDLYYSTGLFTKAKRYYTEVCEVKGTAVVWNSWRRRVIRNNLGQIEMNDGNYYKAASLFDESRKEIGNQLHTKLDSISLGYVFLTKAQALFYLKDYVKTNTYIDSSLAIYEKLEDHSGLFNLYVLKARLSLIDGNAKKANELIGYAFNFENGGTTTQAERNDILLLRSTIYGSLGEQAKALDGLRSYATANDSLFKAQKFAQISQIQSENEYELLKINNEDLKTERTASFLFGIAAILVILTIGKQYLGIRQKNKRLVALAIDSASGRNKHKNKQPDLIKKTEDSNKPQLSDVNYQQLANELVRLIESDKLFLQTDFSLQTAAELLGTNRSYLSKAINQELKQSFTAYINMLRINESIKMISNGNSSKQNINGLAVEVGFGSRSSFISCFYKHTGMLPSTFITNYELLLKNGDNMLEYFDV